MARLLLVHLQTQDIKKVIIVNRSIDKVLELQNEFKDLEIEYKPMSDLYEVFIYLFLYIYYLFI
jgi:glutamyl-tRNA reductase